MKVVAEGAELPGQIERLRELGCDEMQGFTMGRPVPAAQLDGRLAAQR
jgi:EAL domain-containing protein (putative c-di-GMP-specific phosphodiesterase class I)